MTGRIIITGISDAEKAAKEILEHIQAIKDIQRRMVWFAYLRAPLETCRMTGDAVSTQACIMACICSMLLKLKAGMAYFPAMAFSNISLVLTSPNSLYDTISNQF